MSSDTSQRLLASVAMSLALLACHAGRDPLAAPALENVADPRKVLSFETLYGINCAGCHGEQGKGSTAIGLAAPHYLASISDRSLRDVMANGRPRTAMPAFATSAGGMLTDAQIDALVSGVRAFAPRNAPPAPLTSACGAQPAGDVGRGARTFGEHCGTCHGNDGRGTRAVGSIVDESFVSLVSNAYLCTMTVAGRPELGCRGAFDAGKASISSEEISNTVAFLASHRPEYLQEPSRSAQK